MAEHPHNVVDKVERDTSGRDFFISLRGDHSIKYWIDPTEREVKNLHIQPRGRQG